MFRFSLQRVLDYRRQYREKVEIEMQSIAAKIESARSKIEKLQNEIKIQYDEINTHGQGVNVSVYQLTLINNYIEALKKRSIALQEVGEKLKLEKEKNRQELIIASQEEQVLERLKEKENGLYLKELNRIQNNLMDEIAIRNYNNEESN
jgi:flagellar export protein FliJ